MIGSQSVKEGDRFQSECPNQRGEGCSNMFRMLHEQQCLRGTGGL